MNRALKILLIMDGVVLFAGAMLGPIYALFVERIGGDILSASGAFAVYALVSALAIFIIGKFEDKIKELELMVSLGYLIMALGFLSYIFVRVPFHLFIAQAIIGLGEAFYKPAFDGVYSKHLNKNKRASQWGKWEAMYYMAIAPGALLGGLTAKFLGFDALFIIMSLLCFLSAAYIYFLPRKVL